MADFELPVTRYATSGDVNIAYQTMPRWMTLVSKLLELETDCARK